MYNETSNAWIDGFAYDISNWSLHDFGSTSDTIIFGFKNDLTSQDAKIVVFDFNTTFRVKNEYFLQSYAPSIAPLNNSFLVINDTSLVEINTKTNVTNVLSNNSDSIPYYYPAKIRAFSNQEVLIQTGNTIRAYLIVNNLLSLAWSILISDTYLFEIFQSTRELMLFIQHYNYQSGNPYSGYLILSSGMTDPTYDFYSLGISDNSPSASTYYSYFSSSSSGDNFGPGFLFGIVFTGLLAGVWYGYSRSHSRRKILRNGVSSHSSTQFNIAPNKVICINCRNKLEEGSVYCSYCGQNQIESKSI